MRGRVIKCALAVAGLGVVATAATALSTRAPTPYDQTLTLAGGAGAVDPDAPIATARYGDAPRVATATATSAAIDLAGAPSATALAGATPTVATAQVGTTAPVSAQVPATIQLAEVSPPIQTLDAPRKRTTATRVYTQARATPALSLVRPMTPYAKVARIEDVETQPFTPPSQQTAFKRLSVNASALLGKLGTSAEDTHKGRWLVFAASSGKALSLNMIRDSMGWRGAGWSQERLARYGTHQLGFGWRKDNKQLSLSATRRKLNAQDYSQKDVVYGVSLSIKGR